MIIQHWHGCTGNYASKKEDNSRQKLLANLEKLGVTKLDDRTWEFNGTLQDFVEKWEHKFMAYPITTDGKTSWTIFITHYDGFGQR